MNHTEAHNAPTAQPQEEHHRSHRWSTALKVGALATAGGLILAPYVMPFVLPALGVATTSELTMEAMTALHGSGGTGIAGAVNNMLAAIPGIGAKLAEGGIATAVASGAVGVGGVLLGRFIGKREDGSHFVRWGKVIATTAMVASALIALPTVLTGISAGIVYMCGALGSAELAGGAVAALTGTLGAVGSVSGTVGGLSGAAATLPHLLTCGVAAVPAAISYELWKKKSPAAGHALHLPERSQAPAHAAPPVAAAASAVAAGMHDDHSLPENRPPAGPRSRNGTIDASIRLEAPTEAGKECKGVLILKHAKDGTPVKTEELKVLNEAIIHNFLVDSTLKDYHHIHPAPTDVPGEYAFSFTPRTSQPYTSWATMREHTAQRGDQLKVSVPSAVNRSIPPSLRVNNETETGGLKFNWKNLTPMEKGKPCTLEVTITDRNGKPVTDLQPILGEWAHLEGFSADGKTLIHSHPTGPDPASGKKEAGPVLRFTITPENDGMTQFYCQVKHNGQDIYAPFGQMVRVPQKAAATEEKRSFAERTTGAAARAGMAY